MPFLGPAIVCWLIAKSLTLLGISWCVNCCGRAGSVCEQDVNQSGRNTLLHKSKGHDSFIWSRDSLDS